MIAACMDEQEIDHLAATWHIKPVGPTVPSAYLDNCIPTDKSYGFHLFTPMSDTCKSFLDANPSHSVLYVSFGSLATPSSRQIEEVAHGLYNTGKPFLWVVRSSEATNLPENFADKAKDRGIIVSWSPQLEVLAHPAVGCFFTHCGWNSTMEALSLGVPMVAMPYWSDQPTNAKYVRDVWKVGVRLQVDVEEGVVKREEVERCVREVMDGERKEEFRNNALKWKERAKEAVSEGGSSDNNIVKFLAKYAAK